MSAIMPRTDTENIVAQVALEAIINDPSAYELETIVAVVENARRADVGQMYLNMGEEILVDRITNGETPHSITRAGDLAQEVADYLTEALEISATAVGREVYIPVPEGTNPDLHADAVVDVVEAALTIIRRRNAMPWS